MSSWSGRFLAQSFLPRLLQNATAAAGARKLGELSLEMMSMVRAMRLAGRWIAEHTIGAIILAGIPSLVAGVVGVFASLFKVGPDRVFLLVGLLTFASGLMIIFVLFIRHIVNHRQSDDRWRAGVGAT